MIISNTPPTPQPVYIGPEFTIKPVKNGFILTKTALTAPDTPTAPGFYLGNTYVFESVGSLSDFLLEEYSNESC